MSATATFWAAWVSTGFAIASLGCIAYALSRLKVLESTLAGHVAAALKSYAAELEANAQKARVDLAQLGEQVEQMIDDARAQRARLNGRGGGRPPKEPEGPKYRTVADYKRALEHGQPRDLATEKSFGWVQ